MKHLEIEILGLLSKNDEMTLLSMGNAIKDHRLGSIYSTLSFMQEDGYVTARIVKDLARFGPVPRNLYRITLEGMLALEEAQKGIREESHETS